MKFSHRVVSAAAALCMLLPMCMPIMADGEVPENVSASAAVSSMDSSRSMKEELSQNGNLVTQYVNQEDNKTKTIVWAKGITPPKMGGTDSDFIRGELTTVAGTYVTYEAPYQAGQGWYDVNKTGGGDYNLCFAAAASNSLHWWMQRNSDYIDRYLMRNPDDSQIQKLRHIRDSFESQSKSGVFDIFLRQFADRPKGYWPDILQDQFINGYYPKENEGTNGSPADMEKLLTNGPDPRGGFFYKVFGTELLSSRRVYDYGYAVISNEMKECFMRGDLVLMSYRVNRLQSHVVTLWGAEYDENGKLCGVYFSDSDDPEAVGMQRYMVFNEGGKAALSTRVVGSGAKTNVIESLLILSPGTAQWDEYFSDEKKSLDLAWSNTEIIYDGMTHAPTVTVTNLAPGEQVELVVKGEGINAGTYTATAAFKDEQDAKKYKLPEQPTCQFRIKKAAAPVIRYPDASALQYGQILAESTLSGGSLEYGGFAWLNSSTVPTVGQHSYPVQFFPSQMTQQNYAPVQDAEAQVTVQVAKAVPTVTLNAQVKGEADALQVDLLAAVYPAGRGEMPDGSVSFTILAEKGQGIMDAPIEAALNENGIATAVWKPTKSDSYTIKVTYAGNNNYESASAEMLVNVSQQSQRPIVIHPIETKTYGDESFKIQAEGGSGKGAFIFSSSAPDVISVNNNTATIHKAGTAVITVTKVSDGIFAPAQASVPVTVGKKALTVTAENKLDVLQGEQMPAFTYKVEGLVNGDQFSDPIISVIPQDTNTPGEYEITIKDGQLTNAESYTVAYVSGKLTILPQEIPPTPTPDPEAPNKPTTPTPEPEVPNKPTTPTPEPEVPTEPTTPTPEPEVPTEPTTPTPEPEVPSEPTTPTPEPEVPSEPTTPTPEPEVSSMPTIPEAPVPPVIGPTPEDVTVVPNTEEQEAASSMKPETEKNSLPDSTSDSMPAESTVTTTQSSNGGTVAKVVAGTAVVLAVIAGGVLLFLKRKVNKQ